jgi:hypothetical protein
MTVEELRNSINAALSLGDMLKRFIPGPVDDRVLEYVKTIADSDAFLQLIVDDFFGAGPFGDAAPATITFADGTPQSIDPATIAIIIQLVTTLGPIIMEWIKRRREQ